MVLSYMMVNELFVDENESIYYQEALECPKVCSAEKKESMESKTQSKYYN